MQGETGPTPATLPVGELVSVILPTFNGEEYVGEAVASVLGQTWAGLELIVVDDGSTDGTVDRIIPDPRIRLIRQTNQGVASARNAGLRHAAGELIAFIDQDDRWAPDKLQRQVSYLQQRPDLALVLAHEEMFLEPGHRCPGWLKPEMLDAPHPSFVPGVWLAERAAFALIGEFDESFRCGSDTDWLSRARDRGLAMETLPNILLQKRVHGENESRRVETCHREIAQLLRASIARKRQKP